MMNLLYKRVVLNSPDLRSLILDELKKHFTLEEELEKKTIKTTYYDTFDWRLYANNTFLAQQNGEFKLIDFCTEDVLGNETWSPEQYPAFWQDFRSDTMQHSLRPVTAHRALMPLATQKMNFNEFNLLNKEAKIIAKVRFEMVDILKNGEYQKFLSLLTVQMVKGCKKEYRRVLNFLEKHIIFVEANEIMLYELSMKMLGKCPQGYSAKLRLKLNPTEKAAAATQEILASLLVIVKKNEDGIKYDVDTEFLHDFRVSIRKIRSALNQIEAVFNDELTQQCKTDFDRIAKMTNNLRDMDVYLLKKELYLSLLPHSFQADLLPFFEHLKQLRTVEQQSVAKKLCDNSYLETITKWQKFCDLNLSKEEKGSNSDRPIIKIAKKSIYQRFKHVMAYGRSIHSNTPSAELHKLRIQCKKLRYQLEFFSSLFPLDDITYLMNHLKVLQTNLGDLNDIAMQIRTMNDYLKTILPSQNNCIPHTAAVGALISQLHNRKKKKRKEFHNAFKQFDIKSIRTVFKQLFKT